MKKCILVCTLLMVFILSFNTLLSGQQQGASILATKSLASVIEDGDSLVFTFDIRVDNTGSSVLDSLRLNDFLPFPAGSDAISITTPPTTGVLMPNPGYDGDTDRRVITPASGNMATLWCFLSRRQMVWSDIFSSVWWQRNKICRGRCWSWWSFMGNMGKWFKTN